MSSDIWVKPGLDREKWVAIHEAAFAPATNQNCGACNGMGRHIYVDTDGTMKDVPCANCDGSGQLNGQHHPH